MPAISHAVKSKDGDVRRMNILYSFVPKTGGSSILDFFRSKGFNIYFGEENNKIAAGRLNVLKCPTQHFCYKLLDSIFNIKNFDYSFCVVRHPIARLKSEYCWQFRNAPPDRKKMSFDDFVKGYFREYALNPYIHDNHVRPQHEFVGPDITRIFKFEEGLDKIISEVFKDMKITSKSPISIKKLNASEDHLPDGLNSSTIEMTPETEALIRKFYEKDFEKFSYDV
jgi:hypothetical protein